MDYARIGVLTKTHRNGRLVKWLRRLEKAYYDAIRPPEVLLILRLDPEIAVRRRTDEDAVFVRRRSSEIWLLDDSQLDAHIVDASQDLQKVLADIRQLIWSTI